MTNFSKVGLFLLISWAFSTVSVAQKGTLQQLTLLNISKTDSAQMLETWAAFLDRIQKGDREGLRKMSLSKINYWSMGHLGPLERAKISMPFNQFFDSVIKKIYSSELMNVLKDSTLTLSKRKYPHESSPNVKLGKGEKLTLYVDYLTFMIFKEGIHYLNYIEFDFVKVNKSLMLYRLKVETALP
jgi:hypothetical protein